MRQPHRSFPPAAAVLVIAAIAVVAIVIAASARHGGSGGGRHAAELPTRPTGAGLDRRALMRALGPRVWSRAGGWR